MRLRLPSNLPEVSTIQKQYVLQGKECLEYPKNYISFTVESKSGANLQIWSNLFPHSTLPSPLDGGWGGGFA